MYVRFEHEFATEYQFSFAGLWYSLWFNRFNSVSVRGLSIVYIWLNNSRWYCTGAKIKWCTSSIMCRIITTINFHLRGNTVKFMEALHYTTWEKSTTKTNYEDVVQINGSI